jgi:eukaryotic-like serine/threonine-protein kinase
MVADDDIKPGEVLAGRYRVKRLIGRGGMGVVVAATDTQLHRSVAVKLLLASLSSDKEALARFRREGRAAVLLTSEHAVRVHDVGELPTGVPFMVMELLAGNDLDEVIRERHRIPAAEAVDYLLQATEAIAEAHSHGIVHRDVKPRNIFLTRRADGTPLIKVLDFGLAKAPLRQGERGITDTLAVMGSPEYMSPEQMRGTRDVDPRSDIWGLGVTLYELLTGECPFSAPSTPELFIKVFQDVPRPPHELFADIPFGLSRVVLRCLQKEPAARYQDVAEFSTALEEFASLDNQGSASRIDRVLHTTQRNLSSERPPPLASTGLAQSGQVDPEERRAETVTSAAFDSAPSRARRRGILKSAAIGVGAATAIGLTAFVLGLGAPAPASSEPAAAAPQESLPSSPSSPSPSVPAVAAPQPSTQPVAPTTTADPTVDAGVASGASVGAHRPSTRAPRPVAATPPSATPKAKRDPHDPAARW